MEAIRLHTVVEEDGAIAVTDLPCKKGQHVEIILLVEPEETVTPSLTARRLLNSSMIGLWKDREEVTDSISYARQLRDQAQHRGQNNGS